MLLDYPYLSWQTGVAEQTDMVDEDGQASPVSWLEACFAFSCQLPDGQLSMAICTTLMTWYWLLTLL